MRSPCPDWSQPESAVQLPDVVRGMAAVTRFIYRYAPIRILNHGDLKEWHHTIFQHVVPKDYYAGNFRSEDSDRHCLAINVAVGSTPGAIFSDVPRLMQEFSQQMVESTAKTDEFIKAGTTPTDRARAVVELAAFCVGRFLQIHPFINGNGRISRLSANYTLHRYGYRFPFKTPLPRPSNPSYTDASKACMTGNFAPMYLYLVKALTA